MVWYGKGWGRVRCPQKEINDLDGKERQKQAHTYLYTHLTRRSM